MADIDWDALRTAAREAMTRAYAPYSRYRVGAAALVDDGRIVAILCLAVVRLTIGIVVQLVVWLGADTEVVTKAIPDVVEPTQS